MIMLNVKTAQKVAFLILIYSRKRGIVTGMYDPWELT